MIDRFLLRISCQCKKKKETSEEGASAWPYYDLMTEILDNDQTVKLPPTLSSLAGPPSPMLPSSPSGSECSARAALTPTAQHDMRKRRCARKTERDTADAAVLERLDTLVELRRERTKTQAEAERARLELERQRLDALKEANALLMRLIGKMGGERDEVSR